MTGISGVTTIWEIVKEIDLEPLRQEAEAGLRLVILGEPHIGRRTLASHLGIDPIQHKAEIQSPVLVLELDDFHLVGQADLVILLLDGRKKHFQAEQKILNHLYKSKMKVLIVANSFLEPDEALPEKLLALQKRNILVGSVLDMEFLVQDFARAVINKIPNKLLPLGRNYPLFRIAAAKYLIKDTCNSNAVYSFSTGIAEIVPILNIPLNVADIFVLTKNQAFLIYKLGLTLGFSTEWQDYIAEFGSVLGAGFVFRQAARSLVGLIPLWGIIPKVTVAYSGTYIVGNVVLQWYAMGRHLTKKQINQLYHTAYFQGRQYARALIKKVPHIRLPRPRIRLLPSRRKSLPPPSEVLESENSGKTCPNCGAINPPDAKKCNQCGEMLIETAV